MFLIGNEYVWQSKFDLSNKEELLSINLETLSDEDFEKIIYSLKKLQEQENILIEAEKEKERQEKIKIEEEAKRIADEAKKLAEERAAILKEREEMLQAKQEFIKNRTINRNGWLTNIGLSTLSFSDHFVFIKESDKKPIPVITFTDVQELEDLGWELRFNRIKEQIEEFKEEDKKELEKIEDSKKREAERIFAEIEKAKALKLEQEAADEAEKIAAMSEKEKFDVYIRKLLEVQVPELKTKRWNASSRAIKDALNNFLNMK
jgi:hypothetical protein